MIAALLGVAITYLLSRVLRLRATTISLGNARQQTRFVVLLSFVEFATIAIFRYFKGPGQASPLGVSFDAIDVLIQLVRSGVVVLLPLAIIVWLTRQSTISLGIRKEETSKMIALGVAPSTGFFFLFVLVAPLVGGGFASLTASSVAYGFIIFVLVGFSEELVWRGYVQTRLIARTTKVYGWIAASLLFSLWHLPINYLVYGGVAEAFAGSLFIQFPLGLGFGYIMIRSQNILPSSIYHLFYDWTPSFFQVPGV